MNDRIPGNRGVHAAGDPAPATVSRSARHQKILIIDDDEGIVEFLSDLLTEKYDLTAGYSAAEAISHIQKTAFDVIITDLKLPDMSGIDVLGYAKEKDPFIEVIIVTGYASLETATKAVNLGAASYLTKPVQIPQFMLQIEKAVANRAFHLKSKMFIDDSYPVDTRIKAHLSDMTALYQFARRLMHFWEIPEILMIILEEVNHRMQSSCSLIAVDFLDFKKIYAMPRIGRDDTGSIRSLLLRHWDEAVSIFKKKEFDEENMPLTVFDGRQGGSSVTDTSVPFSIPMHLMGRTIGVLTIFREQPVMAGSDEYQLMYVFTTIVASIIEHAFTDMQAKMQATTDSLTGVANHRMFQETLGREIARADRHRAQASLVFLDIDDFKKINDTHGHLVGDAVIKDLTGRITTLIRRGDLFARYGGEEFALILPETDNTGAVVLAERICRTISEKPFVYSTTPIPYSVSCGVSTYSGTAPRDRNVLIDEADQALYASKSAGKNRVTLFGSQQPRP